MKTIINILIERDGLTRDQAEHLFNEAQDQLQEYLAEGDMESAENICQEFFGLEPDYLLELM